MKDKKEKLAEIFSTMKKKTKSDMLAEFEEELIAAKKDGKTWKQLLHGLEQIGVIVSEKTLANFLKDKLDKNNEKKGKNIGKNTKRSKVKTGEKDEKKAVVKEQIPMPLFGK